MLVGTLMAASGGAALHFTDNLNPLIERIRGWIPGGGGSADSGEVPRMPTAALPTNAWALLPGDANVVASVDVASIETAYWALLGDYPADLRSRARRMVTEWVLDQADLPADVRGQLRLDRLEQLTAGAWIEGETGLVIANYEILEPAPADGVLTTLGNEHVQVMRRGDLVIIGAGAAFTRATQLPSAGTSFNPETVWTEAWGAMPDDLGILVMVPSVAAIPESKRNEMFGALGITAADDLQRMALGISLNGASVLAYDVGSDQTLSNFLGGAQGVALDAISTARATLPQNQQGWASYLQLASDALFSQVTLARTGRLSTVTFAAPRCGLPGATPLTVVFLGAAARMADRPARPFQAPTFTAGAGCGPMAGPPIRVNPDQLRMIASVDGQAGGHVMIDAAGGLRAMLPTMFGALPVAISDAQITQALTGTAGLPPLDQPGQIDIAATMGTGPAGVVILPPAILSVLPLPPGAAEQRTLEDGRIALIVPGAEAMMDAAAATGTPWHRLVSTLPSNTWIWMGVNRPAIAQINVLFAANPLRPLVEAAQLVSLSFDARLLPRLDLYVGTGAAAHAEQARAAINALMLQSVAETGVETSAEQRAFLSEVVTLMYRFETQGDDVVSISYNTRMPLGGMIGPIIGLAAIGYAEQAQTFAAPGGAFDPNAMPQPPTPAAGGGNPAAAAIAPLLATRLAQAATNHFNNPPLRADGKPMPASFPAGEAGTPPLFEMVQACQAGRAGVARQQWAVNEPVWQALGLGQILNELAGDQELPLSVTYSAIGTGDTSMFTVTVFGDANCDGVQSMHTITGSAFNGVATFQAPIAYNEGE